MMWPKKLFADKRAADHYSYLYGKIRLFQGGEAGNRFYESMLKAWKEKQASEVDTLPDYRLTIEDVDRIAASFKHSK